MKKWMKKWRRQAEKAGWRVEQTDGGHIKWYHPDGETLIVTSLSASDHRARKNAASRFRREGLDVR